MGCCGLNEGFGFLIIGAPFKKIKKKSSLLFDLGALIKDRSTIFTFLIKGAF